MGGKGLTSDSQLSVAHNYYVTCEFYRKERKGEIWSFSFLICDLWNIGSQFWFHAPILEKINGWEVFKVQQINMGFRESGS